MSTSQSSLSLFLVLLASFLASSPVGAQQSVSASPDITLAIGGGNLVTSDENVAIDNQLGIVLLESLGALPASTDVVAYGLDLGGDRLFVLDTTTSLAGGVIARRGDVVRYDGVTYSIEFDASAEGVPNGVVVDAVSRSANGLLLSFDTTTTLPGLTAIADEDLVRWESGAFSLALDGSSVGVGTPLDVDAAQDLGGGAFLVSFDTSGSLGGVAFADEDVLRYDGSAWTLDFDASAADADWAAADLDAVQVPEPSVSALGLAGGTLLWALVRGRSTRRPQA